VFAAVLLTAALIVKNEEEFLGTCLASIKTLVDETVIVDTGSTDRSREIAREAGARVKDVAWTGDFSAARNQALDLARGEWILYIDADETARPGSFAEMRAQLTNSKRVGYYAHLHPRPGYTPYRLLRLFRNHPSIRFSGIIHERIWPSLLEHYSEADVGESQLTLDHLGYEGDPAVKNARNLPLLHKALRQDPTRVFSWCHLADIYRVLGRERFAERAWRSALALSRSKTRPGQEDYLPYAGLLQFMVEKGGDARALALEAVGRFDSNAQLWWLNGRALMKQGDFAGAISAFERVLAFGERGDFDRAVAYDGRVFNLLSYDSLATCHFRLGQFTQSRHYYELAEACDPSRLEYRTKAALCTRLERSSGAAAPKA